MNAYSVVAVIPLAWPEDLISQTLAAAGDVARRGASPLSVLALGSAVNDRVLALAGQAQADKLVWLLHPALAEAENLVALSEAAAAHLKTDQHLLLMLPAGADGEELAGQLAAQLDATCLGRCAAIELGSAHVGFERDAWGGGSPWPAQPMMGGWWHLCAPHRYQRMRPPMASAWCRRLCSWTPSCRR